jgi:hypothetical protein
VTTEVEIKDGVNTKDLDLQPASPTASPDKFGAPR